MRFVVTFACLLFSGLVSLGAESSRPNILIVLADDCTYNDLPIYGGENAKTPNIEALAKQSLTFNRAYLAEAMCQPCRSELYSGLYPLNNGCAWNHSACRPSTTSMPHHLGKAGYRVGLAGKVHVKPKTCFPFESVGGFDPSCVRNPTQQHDLKPTREFISRDSEQPFCLVIALTEPHVPWVMGDASKYPTKELKLPPNIADTERTRQDYANYLAEITYMDGQVGEILQVLEDSGKSKDTIVMFTSEQGSQFPGCKWTNWDTGLHTALVVRWPSVVQPGERTNALVQYADVLPTLMEACGSSVQPSTFDGTSFLGVLTGKTDSHREYVYGIHNNIPEVRLTPSERYSMGNIAIFATSPLMRFTSRNTSWAGNVLTIPTGQPGWRKHGTVLAPTISFAGTSTVPQNNSIERSAIRMR